MPENEFEKKVQQQLEELKLPPSAAVWPRVEKELKKKKKRRIVFFILLLAGLGFLGYSGYTVLTTDSKPATTARRDSSSPGKPTPAPADIVSSPATQPLPNELPVSAGTQTPFEKSTAVPIGNRETAKTNSTKIQPVQRKTTEDTRFSYTTPATGQTIVQQPVQQATEEEKEKQTVETSVAKNEISSETVKQPETPRDSTLLATTIPNDSATADKTVPDQPAITVNKKIPSKIKWGFDLSGGTVFNRNHAFSLAVTSQSADFYNNPAYSSSNPSAGGPPARVIRPPSAVQHGPALKAGLAAEWKLSDRSSLSVGLRYVYLSEKIKIGFFKDTTIISNSYQSTQKNISGVYPSLPQQAYTNRYHFIELPLLYQLQLNKGNKLPILWNGGLSASYLVATNAFIYDTAAGGIYYHNRNAFNRFHINLQTGLSFRFGNKAAMQWSVGPELSLGISRLMKQDAIIRNRYLMYGGITARLLFPYRKK